MGRKSFNPFKMLGAWLGLIIGILLSIPPILIIFFNVTIPEALSNFLRSLYYVNPIFWWESTRCMEAGCGALTFFTTPIWLFLVGWGIHSLVRVIRK